MLLLLVEGPLHGVNVEPFGEVNVEPFGEGSQSDLVPAM